MSRNKQPDINHFFVAGINYKKTDALVRSSFAISMEQYQKILELAPSYGLSELFVLSTCNRTEIYAFAEDADLLIDLLCTQTMGAKELFRDLAYVKKGIPALQHLFSVSAGLDSQILGDYEIVGQIKQAMKFAKEKKLVGAFLDRILNCVLQSSRVIKNQTALSDGTVSVSFAAVQYIRQNLTDVSDKKILLIGTGKIGRNTCRNLVDYLAASNITLINRTEEKAAELATDLGLHYAPISKLDEYIRLSDIILVATNAEEPVIQKRHLANESSKLIIDLSIPYNVEKQARELPGIMLVDVDELSKLKDETLQKREAEVPKAWCIIEEHLRELLEWCEMRKHVPVLKAVKTKLKEIQIHNQMVQLPTLNLSPDNQADEKIQRVLNGMASKMKLQNQQGCHYIEAINEFIAAGTN
jgi:glutamyl-tRNA reductase